MTEIEQLNARIGAEYRSIDGRALFRLTWSENAFENRHGTFREFTEQGIFLREVTEVRRVRKYSYIHSRWIFEAWAPGNLVANPETPDAINGDYVPVYVFEDKSGSYLPPNEKVVRFIIAAMHGKVRKDQIPSQEYLEEREIQQTVDSMDDHPAWFQTRPGESRNAIWYKGSAPSWETRRAAGPEDFARVRETAVEKAKIFREEIQEIENLEARKTRLIQQTTQQTAYQAQEMAEQTPTQTVQPLSPMHGGPTK